MGRSSARYSIGARMALLVLATVSVVPACSYVRTWGDKPIDFRPKPRPLGPPDPRAGRPSLFEPNDILLGLKGGYQFTSYTDTIDSELRRKPLTSGSGYAVGPTVFWKLDVPPLWKLGTPRLEFSALFSTRQSGLRAPNLYAALPVLVKFAPVVENYWVAWHVGVGVELDKAIAGDSRRRVALIGVPIATDVIFDWDWGGFILFELRYQIGILPLDGDVSGGRPHDLNAFTGVMFPIDRDSELR